MCTARLFSQGDKLLCTQILPGQGRPPLNILDIRKLQTLGYSMGYPLRSLVMTQYQSVTDRRTDGRLCHCKYTALTEWCAVKITSGYLPLQLL